jgi:colicin import membrane protein
MTDPQLPLPPSVPQSNSGAETQPALKPTLATEALAPPVPAKPKRPWFKKKRIVILAPVLFLLFVGWIGSLGGEEPQLAGNAQTVATDKAQSAEEIAAADAAEVAQAEKDAADAAAKAAEDAAAAEAKAAEDATAAAEAAAAAAAEEAARGTISQQNAQRSAESYLDYSAFSYTGLIGQLEYEGFSVEDATWGVDKVDADWNEQAAKSAKSYLSYSSFSHSGLVDQLIYEGFAPDQAEYGVAQTGL